VVSIEKLVVSELDNVAAEDAIIGLLKCHTHRLDMLQEVAHCEETFERKLREEGVSCGVVGILFRDLAEKIVETAGFNIFDVQELFQTQIDGMSMDRFFLKREGLTQQILDNVSQHQYVLISSPPATVKASLL